MEISVETRKIVKRFGEKTVLDGVDISIQKGEIFGLLGPSGAGKTTLIKILTGQLKSDGGTARINGKNAEKLTGEDYKSYGIMMDNFGVYERLSCYDNLRVFADIYDIKKEQIYAALESVGLADCAKKTASDLSKGMKSRLRLARVFMINPTVLFLDEPTGGLDPATAEEIQQMIFAEKGKGKTVFLTTHTMTEAEKLCDNVALLNEGKIIEYGKPDEICRRYNHRKKIQLHLTDGTDCELPHSETSADELSELLKSGTVETIHTSEPNLESVFMELTGRVLSK